MEKGVIKKVFLGNIIFLIVLQLIIWNNNWKLSCFIEISGGTDSLMYSKWHHWYAVKLARRWGVGRGQASYYILMWVTSIEYAQVKTAGCVLMKYILSLSEEYTTEWMSKAQRAYSSRSRNRWDRRILQFSSIWQLNWLRPFVVLRG